MATRLSTVTHEVPAANAQTYIHTKFSVKQSFINFVLQHYVDVGVEELNQEQLTPLLLLKYHNSLADAGANLGGRPEDINKASTVSSSIYTRERLRHDQAELRRAARAVTGVFPCVSVFIALAGATG